MLQAIVVDEESLVEVDFNIHLLSIILVKHPDVLC